MSNRPPDPEKLGIPGPAGALQAVVETPAAEAPVGRFAVVCHPHPLFGGTLDNKVVHTLARTLQGVGLATVRFNFRGVGSSEGAYDEGGGETEDALAAVEWGRDRWPGARVWLAGFSFGAFIAAQAASRVQPERLITVAPPVVRFDFSRIASPQCPWLIVQGDSDEVVDPQAVIAWAERLEPRPTVKLVPGVDHFFHGRLHDLRAVVSEWAA
jgi:hypothetical protein